ncbi:SulP family inorganic anion transporter [Microbacterium esteraromaticum]|uniref:SulP family inorganic anion transporter n=1 Tax=Microbacterium esteraromaticum TaxID=57043 RepID=UPI0019D404BC|nr:SulP family inorganic anion transporter [Microbacterium esteraromaticum]MBN7794175.1 SulP family inorganic anion transporter [Microbacterium esteraromaticum]
MSTPASGPAALSWLAPTLRGYRREWIGPDVVAGLSAGAVVIPQAMAYATIANLPVQIGLYTCMVPMLVYALLGGSRAMSVSTTSTIATLSATTLLTAGVAADAENPIPDLMALTLIVGVILLLARMLKLGGLVEYISKPTILGVQIGVGATVAIGQLPKLLGENIEPSAEGFLRAILAAIRALPDANTATVLLSVGSVIALLVLKRFAPKVPGPLVLVAVGIALMAFSGLREAGVALIDPVPQGLPPFELPSFTHAAGLVPGAFAIAVMVFLESSAVARSIRRPGEPPIESNRELFAAGAVNAVGAFFQVLPAAGGFSQSAVNRAAGARSQLAALVTVAMAVIVALFLGPVLSLMPQAVLAALVFVAVAALIDVRGLVGLWRLNRSDFWVAAVTTAVGLTAGLLVAVAVGVVGTFVVVLRELNRVRLAVDEPRGGVLTVHLHGPLYTANALSYESAVLDAATALPELRVLVLDAAQQRALSVTVLDALRELDDELAGAGVELRLAAVPDGAAEVARRGDWFAGLEEQGRVFDSVEAAARD